MPISATSTAVIGNLVYLLTWSSGEADQPQKFLSYDAVADRWTDLPLPRNRSLTLLAAGKLVVAVNGSDENGATADLIFDPTKGFWRQLPHDPLGPSFDREAVWFGDQLLLAAKDLVDNPGAEKPATVRLAILSADLTTWTTLPNSQIIGWQPVVAGDRVVWPGVGSTDGGKIGNWGRPYDYGGIFDPSTRSWAPLPKSLRPTGSNGRPLVVSGRVLIDSDLLDPRTLETTRIPGLPQPQRQSVTMIAGPAMILVWGGGTEATNLDTGYLLRL